jgi:hypothetical protein
MTENNVLISQVLQVNWTLASPAASDILWETTRVDTVSFLASSKKQGVSCYNPTGALQNDPLSREAWLEHERIIVDVLVKVSTTPQAAADVRKLIRDEVYRILHTKELGISGIADVYVEREITKVEGSDLVRLTLQVACVNFHVVPT